MSTPIARRGARRARHGHFRTSRIELCYQDEGSPPVCPASGAWLIYDAGPDPFERGVEPSGVAEMRVDAEAGFPNASWQPIDQHFKVKARMGHGQSQVKIKLDWRPADRQLRIKLHKLDAAMIYVQLRDAAGNESALFPFTARLRCHLPFNLPVCLWPAERQAGGLFHLVRPGGEDGR